MKTLSMGKIYTADGFEYQLKRYAKAAEEFEKAAAAVDQPASKLAAEEARKLAKGELPEYARVAAGNLKEIDYDRIVSAWKDEIRKAFLRG